MDSDDSRKLHPVKLGRPETDARHARLYLAGPYVRPEQCEHCVIAQPRKDWRMGITQGAHLQHPFVGEDDGVPHLMEPISSGPLKGILYCGAFQYSCKHGCWWDMPDEGLENYGFTVSRVAERCRLGFEETPVVVAYITPGDPQIGWELGLAASLKCPVITVASDKTMKKYWMAIGGIQRELHIAHFSPAALRGKRPKKLIDAIQYGLTICAEARVAAYSDELNRSFRDVWHAMSPEERASYDARPVSRDWNLARAELEAERYAAESEEGSA